MIKLRALICSALQHDKKEIWGVLELECRLTDALVLFDYLDYCDYLAYFVKYLIISNYLIYWKYEKYPLRSDSPTDNLKLRDASASKNQSWILCNYWM